MVSSLSLLYIHLRLTEVMGTDEFFGGISADLLQLPLVKGTQPFITVTSLKAKQRIGCIGTIDLWSQFEYEELTINITQRGDKDYADLMKTCRKSRTGLESAAKWTGQFGNIHGSWFESTHTMLQTVIWQKHIIQTTSKVVTIKDIHNLHATVTGKPQPRHWSPEPVCCKQSKWSLLL